MLAYRTKQLLIPHTNGGGCHLAFLLLLPGCGISLVHPPRSIFFLCYFISRGLLTYLCFYYFAYLRQNSNLCLSLISYSLKFTLIPFLLALCASLTFSLREFFHSFPLHPTLTLYCTYHFSFLYFHSSTNHHIST